MIRLERFERNDFTQLIEWLNDKEKLITWSGALFSYPLTDASLDWYIQDTNMANVSDAFVYKVVDPNEGKTVGHISLGGISWKNRSARISRVVVGSNERNKGYCQEMVKAVLKIGFEDLKLHRIELGLYDNNKAAQTCYEKCGMQVEGISRDVLWYQDKWWSLIEMSILESEWASLNNS